MTTDPVRSTRTGHRSIAGVGNSGFARRIAYLAAGLTLSLLSGLALVHLPYLIVIGVVAALIATYAVLRWPLTGLVLYTIVFFWRPGETYPVLSALRLELILGGLAMSAMILGRYRASGVLSFDRSTLTQMLLLLALTVGVSVPLAYYRSAAFDGFMDFLKLLVWYFLIVHLLTTRRAFRLYIFTYLAAVSKIAFDGLRAYFSGSFMYAQGIDRVTGQSSAAGNPNALAATCAATLPILLLLALQRRMGWYRLLPAFGVVLMAVTIALSGSRSGFLALFAGLLFLWIQARRRALVGLVGIAVISVGLFVLPDQYKARYTSITSSELDASSQGRLDAWKDGVQMVADRPLTGVGISCFMVARAMSYSGIWLQSHSLYVQVPSEIGVIGAVLFFAYVIQLLRMSVQSRLRLVSSGKDSWLEGAVLCGIGAGVAALLVAGIWGHNFMRYTWYVYGALAVASNRASSLDANTTDESAGRVAGDS